MVAGERQGATAPFPPDLTRLILTFVPSPLSESLEQTTTEGTEGQPLTFVAGRGNKLGC